MKVNYCLEYNILVMKFFLMAVHVCDRQFAVMSPRTKRVRYIPNRIWEKFVIYIYMVFIRQNLREKIVILFLANVSERKTETTCFSIIASILFCITCRDDRGLEPGPSGF